MAQPTTSSSMPLNTLGIRAEQQQQDTNSTEDVWEDLRIETGYSSYTEYLERSNQPTFSSLNVPQNCSIVDIFKRNNSSVTTTRQDFDKEAAPRSAATKILKSLRHPPRNVCLRILLWWLDEEKEPRSTSTSLLDVCGLGLRVSPRFFESIEERFNIKSLVGPAHRQLVRPSLPSDSFEPKHTVIGAQVLTVVSNYHVYQAMPVPILLIVGWDNNIWDSQSRPAELSYDISARMYQSHPGPHGYPISPQTYSPRTRSYHAILNQLLQQVASADIMNNHVLTLSTFPMMHLDTLHIQAKTRSLQRSMLVSLEGTEEMEDKGLQYERQSFRRHIENSDGARKNLVRFVRSQDGGDLLTGQEYIRIEELWEDAIREARQVEMEFCDLLQVQASQASLDQLKKSIDLSNHQIEESKRANIANESGVKIFAVFAFIYIPINTVASIYGMNIEQINGTGHKLWVFAVTSVAALIVTGMTWYLIETAKDIRTNIRRAPNFHDDVQKYRLPLRMFMLWWLVTNGHSSWMWNTNAWFGILTKRTSSFSTPFVTGMQRLTGKEIWSACDFVAYFMDEENARRAEEAIGFTPFA